jgi:hypothetical protein
VPDVQPALANVNLIEPAQNSPAILAYGGRPPWRVPLTRSSRDRAQAEVLGREAGGSTSLHKYKHEQPSCLRP